MPELLDRTGFEESLTRELSRILTRTRRNLVDNLYHDGVTQAEVATLPDSITQSLARDLRSALQPAITNAYIETVRQYAGLLSFALDETALQNSAERWAADYVPQLIEGMISTTRISLQQMAQSAPNVELDKRKLAALLGGAALFGLARAMTVARTTATEVNAASEDLVNDEFRNIGVAIEEIWYTREDEKVCPVCRPAHEKTKDSGLWPNDKPPPAHPNCRCERKYFMTLTDGSKIEVQASEEGGKIVQKSYALPHTQKDNFDETEHPRDESGQFTSGGGSASESGSSDKKPKRGKPEWAARQRYAGIDSDGYVDYGQIDENPSNVAGRERVDSISRAQTEKLKPAQKSAVKNYTGEAYTEINGGLRGGNLDPAHKKTVKDLDTAIANNSLDRDTILYRGQMVSDRTRERLKVGNTFSDPAYTSATFDQYDPDRFAGLGGKGGAVMRIKASKGQNGLASSALSEYPEESEFILPRNTKYKVTQVHDDPDTGRLYVDLEIVNE